MSPKTTAHSENLPSGCNRPIAGINSFGVGGSYAHVIIEGPPPTPARAPIAVSSVPRLVPVSAKSPEALASRIAQLRALEDRAAAASAVSASEDARPALAEP